ncbi:hypothetical protein T12_3342 [Trichinella patagoniensis]|uniref:Uncharacterized protein n=1 Tax=Trichinella patagoniensis TaxID=990121 RepID=A0A0V1ADV3_9BILA|nr:hypothetical protein T12_3342 [Trichinella patagoniensis]
MSQLDALRKIVFVKTGAIVVHTHAHRNRQIHQMQSWRCMRLCVKADLEDNMHACMPACMQTCIQQQYVGPFSPLTAVHAEKTTSPQLLAGRALPTLSLATINPYTQSVACCQLTVNLGQQQQHHHHQQQQQLTKKEQLMTNDNNNNKGILSGSNVLIDANDIGYFQNL